MDINLSDTHFVDRLLAVASIFLDVRKVPTSAPERGFCGAMSKRKRERLDVGRKNDQKKSKPSREDDGTTTLHGIREDPAGKETQDKKAPAVSADAGIEFKPPQRADKAKRTTSYEDSDGQKVAIQTAPPANNAPQNRAQLRNVSASHKNLGLKVTRMKRRKSKRTNTKEHSRNAEAVSNQCKGSRPKKTKRSLNEKLFWKVSDAIGGQMLDLDPIFAPSEE